ncbi:glycosyl hydrolase 108 family protein [Sphingomonas paucimobilis]|uniref:glycosyl hydrolase 108 family protein n=1 Tax=Sphingomonas paucimobilis TaxID=13689 RepID=UPI0030B90DF4
MIDELIGREGGYSNHPADKGGATRWGVTEQVARAYGYIGDMRAYPRGNAIDTYRNAYWLDPGIAKVATRYPAVGVELFDIAVNQVCRSPAPSSSAASTCLTRTARIMPT